MEKLNALEHENLSLGWIDIKDRGVDNGMQQKGVNNSKQNKKGLSKKERELQRLK